MGFTVMKAFDLTIKFCIPFYAKKNYFVFSPSCLKFLFTLKTFLIVKQQETCKYVISNRRVNKIDEEKKREREKE